jgi:hypothetical protein
LIAFADIGGYHLATDDVVRNDSGGEGGWPRSTRTCPAVVIAPEGLSSIRLVTFAIPAATHLATDEVLRNDTRLQTPLLATILMEQKDITNASPRSWSSTSLLGFWGDTGSWALPLA